MGYHTDLSQTRENDMDTAPLLEAGAVPWIGFRLSTLEKVVVLVGAAYVVTPIIVIAVDAAHAIIEFVAIF